MRHGKHGISCVFTLISLVTALALSATACGETSAVNPESQSDSLKGTITISGAFALYPMMVKWANEFQNIHPGVRIDISAGGAGKGATDALGQLVDIGMVSRDITRSELDRGGFYVTSVKGAAVPVINSGNPLINNILSRGVTRNEFADIWVTGKIRDWKDVFPGIQVSGDTSIHVYNRSDACGAGDTWAKYLGKKQEDLLGIGINSDPGVAEAVAKDPLGTGYNNIGYAYDMKTGRPVAGVCIIPIDINENGAIDPDEDFYGTREEITAAIGGNVYPPVLANDLNLLTYQEFKGVTLEFVKWIMTDGQQCIAEAGYVPLPPDRLGNERAKLGIR